MNNRDYENSKLKHKLLEKKRLGCKSEIWALRPDQVKYVEEVLGFETIPYIFRISTKTMDSEFRNKSAIFKEIHQSKRNGNSRLFKKLNSREQKLLQEHGIFYTPVKYKIIIK